MYHNCQSHRRGCVGTLQQKLQGSVLGLIGTCAGMLHIVLVGQSRKNFSIWFDVGNDLVADEPSRPPLWQWKAQETGHSCRVTLHPLPFSHSLL